MSEPCLCGFPRSSHLPEWPTTCAESGCRGFVRDDDPERKWEWK